MNRPTQALHDAGQSIWLDNITRTMLDEGTLDRYIADLSVTGLTSNPTIFEKAIGEGSAYDAQVHEVQQQGLDDEQTFFALAIADLRRACDAFAAVHTGTAGLDGFVSLEVSPELAYDTEATIAQAKDLHARMDRSNVYIKIPGTPEGLPAIEEAIYAGIPVNVTLLFDSAQHLAAAHAHVRGLQRRVAAGLAPDVPSVASLFMSRWDKAVAGSVPPELENRLGLAIGGRAYSAYRDFLASQPVQQLMNAGALPQRLLWASTGTKDPAASDVLFVEGLAAPFTVNTMPEATLLAYADHGGEPLVMAADGAASETERAAFAAAGVDIDALAAKLQQDGAEAFVASWRSLIGTLASKRAALAAS